MALGAAQPWRDHAQDPGFDTVHVFGSPDRGTSVAVGDVNGDGALDIVVGNDGEQNVVYLNDGAGSFDWPGSARPFGTGSDKTSSVAVGDVNGDGLNVLNPVQPQAMDVRFLAREFGERCVSTAASMSRER